jgi:hypothetical protein
MTITDILIEIQQRETGSPLAADVQKELRDLALEFGVEGNPRWLLPVFEAVQSGRAVSPPVFFERDDSDTHSYLAEVRILLRWKAVNEGEYELIDFPNLGWRVYLGHESASPTNGVSGSEYQVTPLSAQ